MHHIRIRVEDGNGYPVIRAHLPQEFDGGCLDIGHIVVSTAADIEEEKDTEGCIGGLELLDSLLLGVLVNQEVISLEIGYTPIGQTIPHGYIQINPVDIHLDRKLSRPRIGGAAGLRGMGGRLIGPARGIAHGNRIGRIWRRIQDGTRIAGAWS